MVRRTWFRLLLAVAAAALAVIGPPALGASATIGTAADAWYVPLPDCTAPAVGCPQPPTSFDDPRFEPGTLHVAARAGVEEARAYVRLDLASLTDFAAVRSGVLRLPLLGDDAGTSAAETAELRACLAIEPFGEASGRLGSPPGIDCAMSAPAVFTAGPTPGFDVPLALFLARWQAGDQNHGLALLPTTGSSAAWRIVLPARETTRAGAPPITATFEVEEKPAVVPDITSSGDPVGMPPDAFEAAPADESTVSLAGRDNARPALLGRGGAPPLVRLRRGAATEVTDFLYPVAFVLPLALLALGGTLGWGLTQPARAYRHVRPDP